MTKNNLLNIASVICKVLQSLLMLLFVVLTVLFVHVQVDGEFYKDKIVTIEKGKITYNSSDKVDSENRGLTLDKMDTDSLYINYLKMSCLLALLFLSTHEFQKVMHSVRNLSTFQNANFKSFGCIGWYAFIYFFIDGFTFYGFGGFITTAFSPSLTPLMMTLFAFIMAEIFKEGDVLMEERELTI